MPQDWFAQFAPQLAQVPASPAVTARISSSDDWFAQNDPLAAADELTRAAGVSAVIPELQGDPLSRFASGAWEMLNPIAMVKGLGHAVANPIDTTLGIARAQGQQFAKAADAYDQGRYSEMMGHGAAGIVPLLGPVAAGIGEKIGQGDIAGGLGNTTGLLTGILAPGALARQAGKRVPGLAPNQNPVAREALAAGEAAGVPIDAATATGNRFIAAAQHYSDRMLGGAGVAGRAGQEQAAGLATMGEQLAAKGYAAPVTAEQAGQGVRAAVLGEVQKHHATATQAYDALRKIEADPANAITVAPVLKGSAAAEGAAVPVRGPRGAQRFAKQGESTEGLFQGVLGDARRNGFAGSADDLRTEFLERLSSAKSLGAEMASGEGGAAALLMEIRRLGGIRPFVKDYQQGAKGVKMSEEFRNLAGALEKNHGMRGGGGIMRADGLGMDDLLTQLQQEGKWLEFGDDPNALWRHLEDIAADPKSLASGKHDLEHLLEATGVKPGEKWWTSPTGEKVVQLPVALMEAKEALRPIYQSLKREADLVPLMGDKARALTALDRLVAADDYVSLSAVDAALGELKSFARVDVPELRTIGQGVAAQAIKQLDAAVLQAAEIAGPEAVAALKAGRQATIAKYGAADVLEALSAEPVKVARGATVPKDAAVVQLRELAKQAPGELPKIGRAFLDDLLGEATADGGFGHAAKITNKWQALGAETKLLLYKDPGYIKDLDNFFRLAKMTAQNANPSGTASTTAAGAQMATLGYSAATFNPVPALGLIAGPYAVSRFLHSAAGVKLLTKGFRIPAGNKAAIEKWRLQVAAFVQATNPNGPQRQPVPISR